MVFLSNGDIIALVTLVATFPPSIAVLCHLIKRARLKNADNQTGMETCTGIAVPSDDL